MKKIFAAVFMAAFLLFTNSLTVEAEEIQYDEQLVAQIVARVQAEYEAELASRSIDIYETQVTDHERSLLERVAMNEAGNQGVQGMRYIVAVILNRVESSSPDFKDTIEEVIFQPNQFATFTPDYISEECKQAVDEELKSRSNYEILWFSRGWASYGRRLFEYGAHKFNGL